MRVSLVVAAARNWVIGKDGKLPWHLPEDLKLFRTLTTGHAVIMGRKTYDSIGKPLPNRQNIVITRNPSAHETGAAIQYSSTIEDALRLVERGRQAFIIGGAQIYELAAPFADHIYLSQVDKEFEGDTLFNADVIMRGFELSSCESIPTTTIPLSLAVWRRKETNHDSERPNQTR